MNNENFITNLLCGLLLLTHLGPLAVVGGIYICNDWTPLCNRLSIVAAATIVIGCCIAVASQSSDKEEEENGESNHRNEGTNPQ